MATSRPGVSWRCGCRDESGKLRWNTCDRSGEAGHGSWGYRTSVTDPATGRRRWITKFGFPTQAKAGAALNKVLRQRDDDVLRHDDGLTLGAYLDQWLERKVATESIRPGTADSYRGHIANHITPTIGAVRLRDVRKTTVNHLLDKVTDGKRSAATVRRIHATLRKALNDAVAQDLIAVNPASGLGLTLPKVHKEEVRPWEPGELATFLDSVEDERLGPLFECAAFTGLRRGEVLGLRWEDIDLAGGELNLRRQLLERGKELVDSPLKTRSGRRRVELADRSIQGFLDQRERQARDRAAWGDAWVDTGRVFTREDGTDIRPDYVSKTFARLSQRAGLRMIRFHDLRHGAASLLLASGTDIAIVSKMLGHSSLAITVDTYSHLIPGVATKAANRAADLVPPRSRTRHLRAV